MAHQQSGKSEEVEDKGSLMNPIADPDPLSPGLYITGIGSQHPPFSLKSEQLAGFMQKLKPWTGSEMPW